MIVLSAITRARREIARWKSKAKAKPKQKAPEPAPQPELKPQEDDPPRPWE